VPKLIHINEQSTFEIMKNKPNILIYSILLIGLFLFFANSCKEDIEVKGDDDNIFTDTRDGNVYKTIAIGNQVWMAENLKYLPKVIGATLGSKTTPCYYVYGYNGTIVEEAKATANYNTFGVLYNWPAACSACPSGWHLPSDDEWTQLTDYLSSDTRYWCNNNSEYIAKSLASTSGWNTNTNNCAIGNNQMSNNSTGFTALPGGRHVFDAGFLAIDYDGYWWSSTEAFFDHMSAYRRDITHNYGKVFSWGEYSKINGYSVRCVKN